MASDLFNLGPTYGAIFLAIVFCSMLYGCTNLQVFWYYTTYKKDPVYMKIAVGWICCLDALHIAFLVHAIYWYLVTNFAAPLQLLSLVWSFNLQVAVNIVVIATIQTFYSVRLLKLNHGSSKVVIGVVAIILALAYTISIVECYKVFTVHLVTEINDIRGWTFASLATISVVDTMIAITSCYVLSQYRTGAANTDDVISTLMVYILNTGALTSLFSIISIITYAACPNSMVFLAIELVSSKLYVNSYMAMLNARQHLKSRTGTSDFETSRTAFNNSQADVYTFRPTASVKATTSLRAPPVPPLPPPPFPPSTEEIPMSAQVSPTRRSGRRKMPDYGEGFNASVYTTFPDPPLESPPQKRNAF